MTITPRRSDDGSPPHPTHQGPCLPVLVRLLPTSAIRPLVGLDRPSRRPDPRLPHRRATRHTTDRIGPAAHAEAVARFRTWITAPQQAEPLATARISRLRSGS